MILPRPEDAMHKAWLYRLLSHLYDNPPIARALYFKGGTCAAMLGWLDRFSVDLDFDYAGNEGEMGAIRKAMEHIFKTLDLTIKDSSVRSPQYFLNYTAKHGGKRSTLKIDTTFPHPRANIYERLRFHEIDRIITCQTQETMFANKLVAILDRYKKTRSIAGRDIYDIHYFFYNGARYHAPVINERTGKGVGEFLRELIAFVKKYVTETIIAQDLNTLLPYERFVQIRKTLKQETLIFLQDELARV